MYCECNGEKYEKSKKCEYKIIFTRNKDGKFYYNEADSKDKHTGHNIIKNTNFINEN